MSKKALFCCLASKSCWYMKEKVSSGFSAKSGTWLNEVSPLQGAEGYSDKLSDWLKMEPYENQTAQQDKSTLLKT